MDRSARHRHTIRRGKYNPCRVKSRRTYSLRELSCVLKIHPRTVLNWVKLGLARLDDSKPYLFLGEEVRRFIRLQRKIRKHTLAPGQFFCPRCRRPVTGIPGNNAFEETGRQLGPGSFQVLIKNKCETCGTVLTLFSSTTKAMGWGYREKPAEAEDRLCDPAYGSVDMHLTDVVLGAPYED